MTSKLRAGVVGAGVFGGYHANKYAEMAGTTLVGVFDPHPERAQAIAAKHDAKAFADLIEMLAEADIVSIAAPAVRHGGLALQALQAGRHVYVEKPLAVSLKDGEALVGAASAGGLILACGFLERAAFAAMRLFEIPRPPLRLECVRLGPPSPRNLDVSVVMDLMIHDLDLALHLCPAEPAAVEADGACRVNDLLDEVRAEVGFEDGFQASFHASRVSPRRERRLTLVYPEGEVRLDLLNHRFENSTPWPLNADFEESPASRDRLGASLAAFVAAVRGEGAPLAGGRDGVLAVDLALAVEQAALE